MLVNNRFIKYNKILTEHLPLQITFKSFRKVQDAADILNIELEKKFQLKLHASSAKRNNTFKNTPENWLHLSLREIPLF